MDSKKHSMIGDYLLSKTLGEGSGTKCKLGVHRDTGAQVAIKIMKRSSPQITESFMKLWKNEVEIMKQLDHPNIVKLFEFDENGAKQKKDGKNEDVLYLVLQLIKGGELFDFIASTGRFSEPIARFYFKQLISGLEYLNNKGLAHRDLKPENLMLDADFNLKIGDFGFSAPLAGRHQTGYNFTSLGTKGYMSPEIHLKKMYNGTVADLFASAVILFIMIAQHPPFTRAEAHDPFYKPIIENNHDLFWHLHSKNKPSSGKFFSDDFKFLISAMLAYAPEQRLSLSEIKGHPWYNGETATYEEVKLQFAKRFARIEHERKVKAQKKAQMKAMKAGAGFSGYKATYRGASSSDKEDLPVIDVKDYKQVGQINQKINTVFSKLGVEELMDFLGVFGADNCSKVEFAPSGKPKAVMRFLLQEDTVEIRARLSRCEGSSSLHAIEFSRVTGDHMNYVNKLETIIDAMGDIACEESE